jgi:hypothetical protein
MPTFDTGNAAWDQGLSSLGNALFPDPSKIAQGYYYGSEARKAQLEGNRMIDQQNADNYLALGLQNGRVPSMGFTQPGQTGAAPILAPPANLPMTSGGTTPSLAATVAPPMPTPAQVSTAAANTSTNVAPYTTGTPPAASPPAPGTPAAPNTTTTNGQAPSDDGTSGALHPASLNPTPGQGGTVYAGPAAANGSMAPPAFDLAKFVYLSQRAGRDAASSMAIGKAYVGQLFAQGQISEPQFRQQLASVGEPGPYQTTISEQGQTTRQGMANAGALAVENARVAGELERQKLAGAQTFTFVPSPTDPSQGTYMNAPGMQAAGAGGAGVPSANPQTAVTLVERKPYLNDQGGIENLTPVQAGTRTDVTPLPATTDQNTAQQVAKIAAMPPGPARQQAIAAFRALSPAQTYDPDKQAKQNAFDYSQLQNIYARRNTGWVGANLQVSSPAYFERPAEDAVQARIKKITTQDPYYAGRPDLAYQQAVNQLIAEKVIESPDQVNNAREQVKNNIKTLGLAGDPRVIQANNPFAGGVQPHMTIHLLKPSPDQPSLGATVTTPQPGATTVNPVTGNAEPGAPTTGPAPAASAASAAPAAPAPATQPPAPATQPPAPATPPSVVPAQRMVPHQPPPRPPAAPAAPSPPHMRGMRTPEATGASLGATVTTPPPFSAATPQPAAAAAAAPTPAPPAANAALPTRAPLQTSAPAGALAPAQGVPDGTFVTLSDGTPGIVKGGWAYRR